MSNSVTDENEQLVLLDILGFPSEQMLFNPLSKTVIYSLGSNIISYNLATNAKTFVQYLSHEIILLKFLDDSQNLLLTVDRSPYPLVCIWELPSFTQIYSQEINTPSQNNYSISNIFLEQIYQEIYLIILTSDIGINYLYILKNENELNNNYSLELFSKISYIKEMIYGFKVFYNSKDIIFLLERNLLYYNLDLDKENCSEKMKIDFPFSLIQDSLRINKDINIISFLTSKGNCLIYDQNGNNKPSINPYGQEIFTACEFEGDSICLGTNNGKIYVYNIYDNKPKFFIHHKAILRIKDNFQLNSTKNFSKNNNSYNYNENDSDKNNSGAGIKYIYLNEKNDLIFLRLEDNSILLSPINILMDNLNMQNDDNPKNNDFIFYAFNHSKNIDDFIINNYQDNYNSYIDNDINNNINNENKNDINIFSCSKDQKIIKYYIDYETNKLSNSFFNLKDILSNTQSKGTIINNNIYNKSFNKNINENQNMVYLTVLKYHPLYTNKLFAGDNKGFLYLFDTNENKFQYKKPILGTYEIVFLDFSPDGQIMCIGFDTGCQILCDMKRDCEVCLQLNNHYMRVEESEFRKINNQIICFSYFFKIRNKHDNCLLYTRNNYLLEYSKLYYDRNKFNKKEIKTIKIMNQILDIKIHISENYVIILNNTNQIIIIQLPSGIITAVIDLNSRVKNANNIQIDKSGLFLGVICDLYKYNENSDINNYIYSNSKIYKSKRNYIIIFEIGTGKVKTCVNYINPISKIIFDNEGNYLIIAGKKGEISLWKLTESMSINIKYVIDEMKVNDNFWEEYEIKYDNNVDYRNEIVNNSDYVINNRLNKNEINQVKHDINFNNKTYNKENLKNSISSNNNYNNSYSNISSNYFRRNKYNNKNESERINKNKYESERISDYQKKYSYTDNIINNINKNKYEKNFINKNDYSNNYNKNSMTSIGDIYNKERTRRAPLLIDSKQLLKEKNIIQNDKTDNLFEKRSSSKNLDYNFDDTINNNHNNKEKVNNIDISHRNDNYIKKNEEIMQTFDKNINNNNIHTNNKYNNDIIKNKIDNSLNNNNINYKLKNSFSNNDINNKKINDNNYSFNNKNKDNYTFNKNSINGMEFNYKSNNISKKRNDYNKFNNNIITTTSRLTTNKNLSQSMKYLNQNTYNHQAPKLKHINIISHKYIDNNTNNKFYRTQTSSISNNRNKNLVFPSENTIYSSKDKNEEERQRQRNIRKAINRLLDTYTPSSTLEREKNIQLTIRNQNEQKIFFSKNNNNNLFENRNNYNNNINNIEKRNDNYNYKNDVRNQSINEDFMVISNQKINKNEFNNNENTNNKNNYEMISSEIRSKFGVSKKYPEPDDIDDNLINSHVEPIPDLEHHSKIQKIDMDDLNQFDQQNTNEIINKKNSIKENNKINNDNTKSQMQMNIKNNDENGNKNKNSQLNDDKEIYIKNRVIDDDNILLKSSDEEFNENNNIE